MDSKIPEPEAKAFVKWGEFPRILEQANTGGVTLTLLTKLDGALLSFAGDSSNHVEHVVAALVGNMWKAYDEGAKAALGADHFHFLLVDCENGKLAVTRIGRFLLSMYSDKAIELGLLRAKMNAFSNALQEPLIKVYPDDLH